MKGLFFLPLIIIMGFINNGCIAQGNNSDKQVIKMLTEFYTTYSKIWSIKPGPHFGMLYKRLDSLQKIYCIQKIRKEAKEWFDDGHDLLTNDFGIDVESIKSMTIAKDTTKVKSYLVSYEVIEFPVSPNKPIKERITLHVNVVNEEDKYKIAAVK
ncbi:MAG: hypothetical protein ACXVMS_15670 [Flavisolibacter sp.]